MTRMNEHRVNVRTRARYAPSDATAQKLQAIARFGAAFTHDFNNIMTAISARVDLLLDDDIRPHHQHEDLIELRKGVDEAIGLLEKIMTFARSLQPELEVIDLNALLQQLVEPLQRRCGSTIELITQLPDTPCLAMVDRNLLIQILWLLSDNACEALPQGGHVRVQVATTQLDRRRRNRYVSIPAGEYVTLTLADSGPGIAEAIQPYLFEPGCTTHVERRGAGFGLATCYTMLRHQDGYMWVETGPHGGTSVTLFLRCS